MSGFIDAIIIIILPLLHKLCFLAYQGTKVIRVVHTSVTYLWELNLVAGYQIAIDLNLVVWYGITIDILVLSYRQPSNHQV